MVSGEDDADVGSYEGSEWGSADSDGANPPRSRGTSRSTHAQKGRRSRRRLSSRRRGSSEEEVLDSVDEDEEEEEEEMGSFEFEFTVFVQYALTCDLTDLCLSCFRDGSIE